MKSPRRGTTDIENVVEPIVQRGAFGKNAVDALVQVHASQPHAKRGRKVALRLGGRRRYHRLEMRTVWAL